MIRRIGRRRFSIYAYDVESHNDDESVAKNETSVWLSSFINEDSKVDDESSYFYDIPSFLDKLDELTNKQRTNKARPVNSLMIYVYNFSFEWSFLLPVILKRGFKFKEKINDDDSMVFNSISNKSCASLWDATLKFGAKSGIVTFKDLSKVMPGGLSTVAKSFGLKTQKGELDYRLNRLHGHVVTKEEKAYNFNDARIIVELLQEMDKRDDKDFWKSSSAATYATKKMIRRGWPRAYKPMAQFRKWYPLLDKEESEFLRNGVAGGITYAPSRWQFKEITQELIHIDAHQMHPSQGYEHLFPYGKGIYFKGKPPIDHVYISCLRVKISYTAVRLFENIRLIGVDMMNDVELTVWDFELPTMAKCYVDFKYEIIDGYAYRCRFLPWREFYDENYQARKIAKKEKDDFGSYVYKLYNNSSYGKLIEHGHEIVFENCVDDNGVIDSIEHKKENADINATYTYIPVGSCIAARSRVDLIDTAFKFGWENVVYFDTDSIFAIKNEKTIATIETLNMKDELGGWGRENDILVSQFTAPKRYKLVEIEARGDNFLILKDVAHLAGVNFGRMDSTPAFEDLNIVDGEFTIQGVKRCKGGSLIIEKEKQLGVQKKYKEIYKENLNAAESL